MTDTPRIYAACLAAYNAGRLHGAWIDCDEGEDAIWAGINAMLAKSPEPNVERRICAECGTYHTRSHYGSNPDDCRNCGAALPAEWFPSAEEWAIHDHEGFAGTITSEWPAIADLPILAEGLTGDHRLGFLFLVNDRHLSAAEALAQADDVQIFQSDAHDLAKDYAYDLASETVEDFEAKSSQWPFTCIDWEAAGRELTIGGDIELCELDGERFLVTNPSEF